MLSHNPDAPLEAGWSEVAIICSICPAPRMGHPTQNFLARPAGLPPDRPQTYKRGTHMTSIAMNRDGNRFLCKTSIQTGNNVLSRKETSGSYPTPQEEHKISCKSCRTLCDVDCNLVV